jgi:protein involved in polysaccharide export with SLBB domain
MTGQAWAQQGQGMGGFGQAATASSSTQGAATTPIVGAVSGQINASAGQPTSFSPVVITNPGDGGRGGAEPGAGANGGPAAARTPPAAPSEFETFVFKTIGHALPRFGASLLTDSANGFAPPTTATVPPGYTLNPGDELVIGVTGSVEAANLHVVIDSEGRIFIPRIGAIQVGGVRYGDLAALLRERIGRDYRDFNLSVAVGRLHGLRVYVTGYAAHPGSYTVNSLSTLVNGVLAAGGPSGGGSFRFIELRRDGRVITKLDLYDLLLKGDKSSDVVLRNEDVIYIGPVGPEVAVTGSVNAEAIYEMKPGESLRDVLAFAGGLNSVADSRRLLVERLSTADAVGWEQLTMAEAVAAPTERGEIVRVLSAVDLTGPIERQAVLASIAGEVTHPGHYYMPPGSTLGDLMARAGGVMPSAFVFGSQFTRVSVAAQQKASFERAMADLQFAAAAKPLTVTRDDGADIGAQLTAINNIIAQLELRKPDGRLVLNVRPDSSALPTSLVLENNDQLLIPTRPVAVGVAGAVKQPGAFLYADGRTLAEYLARAGGLQRIADRKEIFVVRADGSVISGSGGWLGSNPLDRPALPGDLIVAPVRNAPSRFWAILKDATQTLYQTALGAASVKYLTQ